LRELVERKIESWEDRIESFRLSYGLRRPFDMVAHYEQRCDELVKGLFVHADYCMKRKEHALVLQRGKLEGLNPLSVLRRGYSICRRIPESVIIREAGALKIDDEVEVTFYRGTVHARVETVGAE
jgi:exodeoxyribonuclease VII large subunit